MACIYVILLLILIILVLLFFHLFLWPRLKRQAKAEEEASRGKSQAKAAPIDRDVEPIADAAPAVQKAAPVAAAVSNRAKGDPVSIAAGRSTFVKISDDAEYLFARGRKRFVAVDINTIGTLGNLTPVEVSAVRFIDGKEAEHYSTYICPKRRDDGTLPELIDIEPEELEKAPKEREAFATLSDFLGDDLLAAHNASFDARLLVEVCNRVGLTKNYQFFDTLAMARELFPNLENHKLPTIVEHMKTPQLSSFRSYNDCTAVAAILNAYFARKQD